jgi:NADPH:quinone reductase-like Zn-dependent oxidoreductase
MGIIPENEYLIGLEGAGIVRRVGNSVTSLKIGQRVLLHNKGAFANRLQVSPQKCHVMPDEMSFEVNNRSVTSFASMLMSTSGRSHDGECISCHHAQSFTPCKYAEEPSKPLLTI